MDWRAQGSALHKFSLTPEFSIIHNDFEPVINATLRSRQAAQQEEMNRTSKRMQAQGARASGRSSLHKAPLPRTFAGISEKLDLPVIVPPVLPPRTLAQQAYAHQKVINIADLRNTAKDSWDPTAEEDGAYTSISVLIFPVMYQGEVLGLVQLVNKQGRTTEPTPAEDEFSDKDDKMNAAPVKLTAQEFFFKRRVDEVNDGQPTIAGRTIADEAGLGAKHVVPFGDEEENMLRSLHGTLVLLMQQVCIIITPLA